MGWELGFLEGICFAILIGLSYDFVLHMARARVGLQKTTQACGPPTRLPRNPPTTASLPRFPICLS